MPNRAATSALTFFANATQSAIVTPAIGTNGTTSTAPSRGCSPRCPRRSMSDPLRIDGSRAHADVASASERDAKIEQLLLVGLDHYFAARYELAINVWTRALFLDRSHARARAYIDRARSALAERLRESEELLQNGVAAFHRGEADEARRLLQAAIEGGAPSDEALAILERMNRLQAAAPPAAAASNSRSQPSRAPLEPAGRRAS